MHTDKMSTTLSIDCLKHHFIDFNILLLFKVFDKNGDGMIDAEELKDIMANFGEKMSEDEIMDMIKAVDVNQDGKIDIEGGSFFAVIEVLKIRYFFFQFRIRQFVRL